MLVTGNAAGELAPSFIVFTGKYLPDNAAAMAPPNFAFGYSQKGYMVSSIFFEFVANIFEPWLTANKKKPPSSVIY